MPDIITGKLNVSLIEKSRLFKGEKGTYLDIVLIPSKNNQYGDYMIVQSVTKEEREAGKRGPILGNAKILVQKQAPKPERPRTPAPASDAPPEDADSVPF